MKNKQRLVQRTWIHSGSAEDVETPSRLQLRRKYVQAARIIVFLRMSVAIRPIAEVPEISIHDYKLRKRCSLILQKKHFVGFAYTTVVLNQG
jgi:hypothetical protein